MTNSYMQRCSALSIIGKMHIEITMGEHIIPVRMAIIKDKRCIVLVRAWREGRPCMLLVGMQIGAAIVENSMEALWKMKYKTTT